RAARQEAPRPRGQGLDPRSVPERRPVRHRRRADGDQGRRRRGDVLQQAGVEAQPGPGGAALRAAPVTLAVQPLPVPDPPAAPPRHRGHGAGGAPRYPPPPQARAAEREPLNVHVDDAYHLRRQPYVFDYVQEQLISKFGLKTVTNGGLKVYTTIDMKRQAEA